MVRAAHKIPVKEALAAAAASFSKAGLASAWLDAELLLAHVLKKERSFLLTRPELILSTRQEKAFSELIKKRLKYFPIAYLLGHKEFYGLDFIVTPDVLVPRPESEMIVELVKDMAVKIRTDGRAGSKGNPGNKTLLIDVGTGSGCLPVVLAPQADSVIALDISPKALAVARKNGRKHGRKNIRFIQSDLLTELASFPSSLKGFSNIIITANLPYLTAEEIRNEKTISREPRLALDGGAGGLVLYRKLAKQLGILTKKYPLISFSLLCEINPGQKRRLAKIWHGQRIVFHKDLNGLIRIAEITLGP